MKTVLRIAAWLSLVGGLVAGVAVFAATRQLGVFALGAGIGYVFTGFVVWALLLVVVQMAERLERVENGVYTLQQRTAPPKREVKSYSVLDRI